MGSLAVLAKELGHRVTGSDANVYPPMSTQLEAQGIELMQGYEPAHLQPAPDLVVVGNALSRGNPAVEYVLNQGLPYVSGPQWLADHVLQGRWVLGVAGTHGKTTTTSMLAWVLEHAGMSPGFLIGGVPQNFGVSARLGGTPSSWSRPTSTTAPSSTSAASLSTTARARPSSTTLNSITRISSPIWPPSSGSSTTWYAPCRGMA